ncbi:hypothetical protein BCR36DRAFT_584563 [Piromyces finnis]|uniref:Uncharacterized protein n=1 Tax=Piromyces finnis TaxID=1754191 RepID=A0A1Y1V5L4_9FUNG|nr:hypothetical protein BCR36DRAFT_584563 [Piromyces finnis]|eukprot:ORX47857.1 hypothetical protein BCR36DRAFT_584563 [Piromyces finnis]
MKSLAKKISQNFVRDSDGTVKDVTNDIVQINKGLKKKKSIKDMMVDTFKNPFSYLKSENNGLPKNGNIKDIKYTTFSSSDYESVFSKPVDPVSLTKSDPSRLIYVPKCIMQETDIQTDIQSSIFENGNSFENNINDSTTVNSKEFNDISVQVAFQSDQSFEQSEEKENQSLRSTFYSDISNENQQITNKKNKDKKDKKSSLFSLNFIKSKLSFSKSEINTFCNDNKLTSYERYENYSSDNEMADISEDETAIELKVFHPNKLIDEKNMILEPKYEKKVNFQYESIENNI